MNYFKVDDRYEDSGCTWQPAERCFPPQPREGRRSEPASLFSGSPRFPTTFTISSCQLYIFISHLETLEVEDICEDEGPLGELLVAGLDDVGEDHAVRAVHRAQLAGEAGAQLAEAARDQNPAGEVVLLPTNNTAEDTAMTHSTGSDPLSNSLPRLKVCSYSLCSFF